MTGVKGFIADKIPQSWDYILRKKRCYHSFIDQFYEAIAPVKNRNKYYYKVSIQRANHYIKWYKINVIATMLSFKEGIEFWNDIANQISNYELNCN